MTGHEIVEIPLDKLLCDDIRLGRSAAELKALAQSIAAVGQLYPIRVRREGDCFPIVDGHRRTAALRELGKSSVQAIIVDRPLEEADRLQQALISNIQRESLGPVETALATKRLMDCAGWNVSETAAQLGFAVSTVTKLLAILSLPEAIVEQVASKQISTSAAYELSRIKDPQQQAEAAQQLASGHLTRDAVSRSIRRAKSPPRQSACARPLKRALVEVGDGVSLTVAAKHLDFDSFIGACDWAVAKAKRARGQSLSFETFLKVVRDQTQGGRD